MHKHEDVNCPHCYKPIGMAAVSALMDQSRFSFVMKPKDGELLGADTVGGCIQNLGELMDAGAEAYGAKSRTVVEGIEYAEDGTITVNFLITRIASSGPYQG